MQIHKIYLYFYKQEFCYLHFVQALHHYSNGCSHVRVCVCNHSNIVDFFMKNSENNCLFPNIDKYVLPYIVLPYIVVIYYSETCALWDQS